MMLSNLKLLKTISIPSNLTRKCNPVGTIKKAMVEDVFKKQSSGIKNFALRLDSIDSIKDNYRNYIIDSFEGLPQSILDILKKENYRIYLTNDKEIEKFSKKHNITKSKNNMQVLGLTYCDKNDNVILISDKIPIRHIKRIINHETGHAISNSFGLYSDEKFINALKKDLLEIKEQKKLNTLTKEELELITHYFLNPNSNIAVDEIIADIIAWQQKAGCYGSRLTLSKENPSLMQDIFTNLAQEISKFLNSLA